MTLSIDVPEVGRQTWFVGLGHDIGIPGLFTVHVVDDDDLPFDLEIHVEFFEDQLQARSIIVTTKSDASGPTSAAARRSPWVTTEGLRRIPVTRIIRSAAEQLLTRVEEWNDGTGEPSAFRPLGEPPSIPRNGPDRELLAYVAVVYRLAHACHEPATKAVAERFGIPHPTASNWVKRARLEGLLGAAPPRGRSGEIGWGDKETEVQ